MNLVKVLIAGCMLTGMTQVASAKSSNEAQKDTVTFQVPMKCHKCQAKIEDNISFEKGVTDLSVNLEAKTVTVIFKKKKTDIEKLKAAFKKLGYDVVINK